MPSKEMQDDEYAPKAWSFRDFDFMLPSGDKCRLRKMDPMLLVESDLMDKLDFATGVVMGTHVKNANRSKVEMVKTDRAKREARARGKDPDQVDDAVALANLRENPEQLLQFRSVLDEVLLIAVVKPTMHKPPEDDDERVDGLFYTDSVPFNDKIAVFNKVMEGVNAVAQFRKGSEAAVGDVAPEPSVRPAPKRAPRAPRKRTTS